MKLPLIIQKQLNKKKAPLKTYWMVERISGKENFGDMITPFIIEGIFGYKTEWTPVKRCDLACVGSILELIQEHSGNKRIRIWGCGFIKDGPKNEKDNLDFYAVRGPSTLSRITQKRHVALGDPGILANRVFKRAPRVTHKVGIVAHYVDLDAPELRKVKDNKDYKLINPLQSPQKVAEEITSCEVVFSSSLHGLIFADSFCIPNFWLPLSDRVLGGAYKFDDYYKATGRELVRMPVSVLEDRGAMQNAIAKYQPIANLKKLQRDLVRSFPF
jgi:pyruvyltransferase